MCKHQVGYSTDWMRGDQEEPGRGDQEGGTADRVVLGRCPGHAGGGLYRAELKIKLSLMWCYGVILILPPGLNYI